MKQIMNRLLAWIMLGVLGMSFLSGCSEEAPVTTPLPEGWLGVTPYQMGFVAVGTNGAIGEIDALTGEVTAFTSPVNRHLRAVAGYNDQLVAVGEAGTVLYATDPAAFMEETGAVSHGLHAVIYWNDKFVAAGAEGAMQYRDAAGKWTEVDTGIDGTIVALAASPSLCMGMTADGRVLTSTNMTEWGVFDYNDYYKEQITFTDLLFNGTVFYALGKDKTNAPVVISTLSGEVWGPRGLDFYNNESHTAAEIGAMNGLAWDGQQLFGACSKGQLYTMPDCAQCNKLATIGKQTLNALAYNGGKLAAVGEGFEVVVKDTEAVRQYAISADTAYEHQQKGAVLVDVRPSAEFDRQHIKDAVNIPLEEIGVELPAQFPGKSIELIFYCSKGIRSQTALEQALAMGYNTVYCLEDMSQWDYDFDAG